MFHLPTRFVTPLLAIVLTASAVHAQDDTSVVDYVGIWKLADEDGDTFYLQLMDNHLAETTYAKGKRSALGERGVWRMDGENAMVAYDSGWVDILKKTETGFEKMAFSDGDNLSGEPNNTSEATRLKRKELRNRVPEFEFVGFWKLTDEQNRPYYLHVKDDYTARTSYTHGTLGVFGEEGIWRWERDRILVAYDSGWIDLIVAGPKDFTRLGYAPRHKLDGYPDISSKAERADAVAVGR